ncbi:hypothetical protein D3C73_988020 [compost metagenome]
MADRYILLPDPGIPSRRWKLDFNGLFSEKTQLMRAAVLADPAAAGEPGGFKLADMHRDNGGTERKPGGKLLHVQLAGGKQLHHPPPDFAGQRLIERHVLCRAVRFDHCCIPPLLNSYIY